MTAVSSVEAEHRGDLQASNHVEGAAGSSRERPGRAGRDLRVRLLTDRAEIERLRPLARADHEESALGDIPFSDRKFGRLADDAARDPNRIGVIVAEKHSEIRGFLFCTAGEYFIGEGALLTTVTVLYVPRDIRSSMLGGKIVFQLIRAVRKWSEARGVERILFHVTSGIRMTASDKLFKKIGARLLGGNYMLTRR
jgi:L-amino acid N-acyltransferase YncA